MFRQLNKGLCIKVGCLFIITLLLVACGSDDLEPTEGADQAPQVTATVESISGEPTMTAVPESTLAPSPTVEQATEDASLPAEQLRQGLAEVQMDVDFRLMAPADVLDLDMLGEPAVTGPQAAPIVTVNLSAGGGANARLLTFVQIGDIVSGSPPEEGEEREEVEINGMPATLVTESDGMRTRVHWQHEGATYQLTGVNLEVDEVLQVASSLEFLPGE